MSLYRSLIHKFPVLGKTIVGVKSIFVKRKAFTNSEQYWIERYNRNGDSGPGSYNNLAEFKSEIINSFVEANKINTVIDFGCGDGNQLSYFEFNNYLGLDVSPNAIARCRKKFQNDSSKSFKVYSEFELENKFDLAISLDVIFHLIEDDVFENYLTNLFDSSDKFVIIYSSDTEKPLGNSPHFKQRKFTKWISQNIKDFELIQEIPNKYKSVDAQSSHKSSVSDFYIFKRLKA